MSRPRHTIPQRLPLTNINPRNPQHIPLLPFLTNLKFSRHNQNLIVRSNRRIVIPISHHISIKINRHPKLFNPSSFSVKVHATTSSQTLPNPSPYSRNTAIPQPLRERAKTRKGLPQNLHRPQSPLELPTHLFIAKGTPSLQRRISIL